MDFYELADDDVVEVGAKASIDGQSADGEYVMADGNTYKFEAGTLTEIEEPKQKMMRRQRLLNWKRKSKL